MFIAPPGIGRFIHFLNHESTCLTPYCAYATMGKRCVRESESETLFRFRPCEWENQNANKTIAILTWFYCRHFMSACERSAAGAGDNATQLRNPVPGATQPQILKDIIAGTQTAVPC